MSLQGVLIDTGPIVAVLSENDEHHHRCTDELVELHAPLFTCWPVVTEAQWLLRHDPDAVDGLFLAFASGLFSLLPLDESAMPALQTFLRRYRKLKPDLADAALVFLAEREDVENIFTLDRRDFSVYRFGKNRHFHIIPDR